MSKYFDTKPGSLEEFTVSAAKNIVGKGNRFPKRRKARNRRKRITSSMLLRHGKEEW